MQKVEIFTDGGCRGNPGIGGWGALLRMGKHEKKLKGTTLDTTNNRMELTAVIKALEALKRPCQVTVTTDSRYVQNGITEWIIKWRANKWRTASGRLVKNKDLWQELDKLVQEHEITWKWVKGHSGHTENEYADKLSKQAMDELQQKIAAET